jgi:REP element-mobilizing transposase RayT
MFLIAPFFPYRQPTGMARKPRIENAGACYHVLCRGDRREPIFFDDTDRRRFLETLTEARDRTGWIVHSYVFMGNRMDGAVMRSL